METVRMISSPALRFHTSTAAGGGDGRSFELPIRQVGPFRASVKARTLRCEISDSGHLQYYRSPARGDGRKLEQKAKEMKREEKKKMKSIKRLSKDLDFFARTAYGEEFGSRLVGDVKGNMISDATEVLLAELERFKSAQKELKRKRKQEKAAMKKSKQEKAALKKSKAMMDFGSSSSSDSSESDCGEIMEMRRFTHEACAAEQATLSETSSKTQEMVSSSKSFGTGNEDCCGRTNISNGDESSSLKISICMGGKCKKMGAATLLQEFEKEIGNGGSVVSCKCMGKCKYGPNVKVSNSLRGIQKDGLESSVQTPVNPLYLGVKLEDVGAIVATLLSKDRNDDCLAAAS